MLAMGAKLLLVTWGMRVMRKVCRFHYQIVFRSISDWDWFLNELVTPFSVISTGCGRPRFTGALHWIWPDLLRCIDKHGYCLEPHSDMFYCQKIPHFLPKCEHILQLISDVTLVEAEGSEILARHIVFMSFK
jgi:hypothetical protein